MICDHDWENIKTTCCKHIQCKKCRVIKKTELCDYHKKDVNKYDGKKYFLDEESGMFKNNIPLNKLSIKEHNFVFSKVGLTNDILKDKSIFEVGVGIGRLIPLFLKHCKSYNCLEPNKWACEYIENAYFIKTFNSTFEKFYNENIIGEELFDIVFCIHTLEHFEKADVVFEQLTNLIKKEGYLFIEVPNQKDLYNPDHYWFFNKDVLRKWASLNNLEEIGCFEQSIIKREDFIYFLWRKK